MRGYKVIILIVGGTGVLAWLLFGFFGVQALFMDQRIQETVPNLIPATEMGSSTSPSSMQDEARLAVGEGAFVQGDSTYRISGTGTIFQEEGGMKLALTDFEVTNGPDLYVYLVDAPSADNTAVKTAVADGKFVSLGRLKGNIGNQVYALPENTDAEKKVISIWCKRFSRNFGSALIQSFAQ